MNILVAVADYPRAGAEKNMYYVHVRNLCYIKHKCEVFVLNFSVDKGYCVDGIKVLSLGEYKKNRNEKQYDILVCHAPNIRNHYMFLKKYERRFRKIVLFFHGHEVLKINEVYSKPYPYVQTGRIKENAQNVYDDIKLLLWRKYFPQILVKTEFVFVSKWMKSQFLKWTKIPQELIQNSSRITYNSVGDAFEYHFYDANCEKKYDFITIRSNLDGSKYAIDIVCNIARILSNYKFCIVGKGRFFEYYEKPTNVIWIDGILDHQGITGKLNMSKCALMPTRTDAQGVMACEMATFGIPVITSDIDVCREVFSGFKNVAYINNDELNADLLRREYEELLRDVPYEHNDRYYKDKTCLEEIKLFSR